jgi:integrase
LGDVGGMTGCLVGKRLDGARQNLLVRILAVLLQALAVLLARPLPSWIRTADPIRCRRSRGCTTCGTRRLADDPSGASVKAVQAQLGHATASITLDTYGHLFPDELEALADRPCWGAGGGTWSNSQGLWIGVSCDLLIALLIRRVVRR